MYFMLGSCHVVNVLKLFLALVIIRSLCKFLLYLTFLCHLTPSVPILALTSYQVTVSEESICTQSLATNISIPR